MKKTYWTSNVETAIGVGLRQNPQKEKKRTGVVGMCVLHLVESGKVAMLGEEMSWLKRK